MFDRSPVADVADAYDRSRAGTPLIDVREPNEFRAGHPRGARSAPLSQLDTHLDKLPKDGEVLVICASGMRSKSAQKRMRAAGIDAVNVKGGLAAWQRADLPVSR